MGFKLYITIIMINTNPPSHRVIYTPLYVVKVGNFVRYFLASMVYPQIMVTIEPTSLYGTLYTSAQSLWVFPKFYFKCTSVFPSLYGSFPKCVISSDVNSIDTPSLYMSPKPVISSDGGSIGICC